METNKRPRGSSPSECSSVLPHSFSRPVSPPPKRVRVTETVVSSPTEERMPLPRPVSIIKSPFQLTRVQDLPDDKNVDTVSLHDILGDPLISECWEFNYLHDVHFLMRHFDPDVKGHVKVHIVHGFWKSDDGDGIAIKEEASRYENVEVHHAYLPEMFGTHHSKMIILFRHDDTAQVIIHTANMIARDWRNMTQAVWRSPMLPLLPTPEESQEPNTKNAKIGSGERFKFDLLNYLRAYDDKRVVTEPLVTKLSGYDFSAVRGALIASVPGRYDLPGSGTQTTLLFKPKAAVDSKTTSASRWGWPAMEQALKHVPVQEGNSTLVAQVSSIASLGPEETWLRQTWFRAFGGSKAAGLWKPRLKVVFPTADEIRRSLDGYFSGGSIHTKNYPGKSKQLGARRQMDYMRPLFYHWANDSPDGEKFDDRVKIYNAGRDRAAPHIKTYIRYGPDSIDWALVTSANLSKQAWGEEVGKAAGKVMVRVSSYEIGVLVWPSLFGNNAVMLPAYKTDQAVAPITQGPVKDGKTVVGMRIPYSWPLQRYGEDELPWLSNLNHTEKDWKGNTYYD